MDSKISDALPVEKVKKWLSEALTSAGVSSVEALRDDNRVRQVSTFAYKAIPLVPFRAAITVALEQEGFERFVFRVRDGILEHFPLN